MEMPGHVLTEPCCFLDDALLQSLRGLCADAPGIVQFILMDVLVQQDLTHGTAALLFGRTAAGQSVFVRVHGWYPYLFVEAPSGWIDSAAHQDCIKMAMKDALVFALEDFPALQKMLFTETFAQPIVSMELVVGTNIMGFDPLHQNCLFLKQRVVSPLLMKPLRQCWEGGYQVKGTMVSEGKTIRIALGSGRPEIVSQGKTPTFNSNLDPVLQFMVDKSLSGCQWCQVQARACAHKDTYCDLELECEVDALQPLSLEAMSDLGPLKVISFDIEAAGRRGVFPDPMVDPVIQIALPFQPSRAPILLSFKDCEPIQGAVVLSFADERSLLVAFKEVIVHFDPDILTGYNICNFDMEYLQKRAEALGVHGEFSLMTRVRRCRMQVKELYFQSAQVPPPPFPIMISIIFSVIDELGKTGGEAQEQQGFSARQGGAGCVPLDAQ